MCKAKHIADLFLESSLNDPDGMLTNQQIQRLLYLAQGWSLARYGEPLFDDAIEAWSSGPVVPEAYQRLESLGDKEDAERVIGADYADHFSKQEAMLLIDVWNAYSATELDELPLSAEMPWRQAYRTGVGTIIPVENMRTYFEGLPPLPTFELPHFSGADFVGYRGQLPRP